MLLNSPEMRDLLADAATVSSQRFAAMADDGPWDYMPEFWLQSDIARALAPSFCLALEMGPNSILSDADPQVSERQDWKKNAVDVAVYQKALVPRADGRGEYHPCVGLIEIKKGTACLDDAERMRKISGAVGSIKSAIIVSYLQDSVEGLEEDRNGLLQKLHPPAHSWKRFDTTMTGEHQSAILVVELLGLQ